jgi:hypothetical protein
MALHKLLHRMAVRLANLVKDQRHTTLDTKLLTQFMITLRSCPMYRYDLNDPRAYENYMSIAEVVDKVMADYFKKPGRANTTDSSHSTSQEHFSPTSTHEPTTITFSQAGYTSVPRQSDETFYAAYGKAAMKAALVEQLDRIATEAGVPPSPARKPPKNTGRAGSSADESSAEVLSTGTTYYPAQNLPSEIPYYPVTHINRPKSATFSATSALPTQDCMDSIISRLPAGNFVTHPPSNRSDPTMILPRDFM